MHTRIAVKQAGYLMITALLLMSLVSQAAGQQTAFTVQVEGIDDLNFPAVTAVVSVSDTQGFPLKGLGPAHFKISENGRSVPNFSVEGFQNFEQPLAIVLVIDTSGSMAGPAMTNAVAAAKDFSASLSDQDLLGLVTFATQVTTPLGLTNDRAAVNTHLDAITAVGDTSLNDALITAVGLLKNRSERRVIVLLTDGRESGISKFSFDNVVNEAVRWSTPVFPIGFGSVDQKQLERLAQLTGGAAQVNPDSTTLAQAFNTVLTTLREQYRITYTSSQIADGLEHPLEISVEYQNGFASASRSFTARHGAVTITMQEPQANQTLGGKVRIAADVLAPAEVEKVDFEVDGQITASDQDPPFETVWDTTLVQPGIRVVKVTATDRVGNTAVQEIRITVRAPILLDLIVPTDKPVAGTINLLTEIDSVAPVSTVTYFVDGVQLSQLTQPPFEPAWDTTTFEPGPHTLRVRVVDMNGYETDDTVDVMVEMQAANNLIWLAILVAVVAVGLILPFALRRRRKPVFVPSADLSDDSQTLVPGVAPAVASFVLIEREGMNPGQIWALGPETRLGRKRDENDIPLLGLSASRRHAILRQEGEAMVLQVLNPQNPVLINGKPHTTPVVLCSGDLVQIGESTFEFAGDH